VLSHVIAESVVLSHWNKSVT